MQYWLFKSEPESFSFDMLKKKGKAGQEWDGVRNFTARNNMRAMQVGDLGFFYHSQQGLDVVGIVEVVKLAHRDSTSDDERWECVDIRAVRDVPKPVTLEQCKADKRLKDMVLVNNARLSVQPVSDQEWKIICDLGGVK
jgi:predicted RNA-binding protein with PUA-like domain